MCEILNRKIPPLDTPDFAQKVELANKYLQVVLDDRDKVKFWEHRRISKPEYFASDGVHLGEIGNQKLWRSWRGAVLDALKRV